MPTEIQLSEPLVTGGRRPLRVLHVAVSLDKARGGTAQAPLTLCRALRSHGVDAQIASAIRVGREESSLVHQYPDVPVREFPTTYPSRFTASAGLRSWLQKEVGQFDLVEVHELFAFPPLYGRRACRSHGVPYLLNIHNGLNPRDLRKRWWLKAVFRHPFLIPLIRDAWAIKATSKYEVDTMRSYIQPPPVYTLPLPVEPPSDTGNRVEFRRTYGIPEGAVVVGCVGRLEGQKALEVLIEAFAGFRAVCPDAWLLLVGRGTPDYTAHLIDLIRRHQLEGCSTLPGFLTGADKSGAFLAVDLYAQVSWYENFCISLAEAMAMGLPCLVSDQVGLASDVLAARSGFGCVTSVAQVSEGLRKAWEGRAEWSAMGRRARDYFANHFTISAVTPKLVELYEKVARSTAKNPVTVS